MKDYTLLSRHDYFQTVIDEARHAAAGQRIILAAMAIDPLEPIIAELARALETAAQQGAHVTLLVDALNFLQHDNLLPGPMFYNLRPKKLHGKFDATWQMLQSLSAVGANFCITNVPKQRFHPAPFRRSHIKGAVIGDRVFVGGCNLVKPDHI